MLWKVVDLNAASCRTTVCHTGAPKSDPRKLPAVIAVIALLVLFSAVNVRSESDSGSRAKAAAPAATCHLADFPIFARPAPEDGPTIVEIGLSLIDVTSIKDTSQSITADFAVKQTWTDPRLAGFEGCHFSLEEVWTPKIDIANSGRLFTRSCDQYDLHFKIALVNVLDKKYI